MKNTWVRGLNPRLRLVAILLTAMVAFTCWALSSPAGSSPDDDFHLASIWCGAGDRQDLCERTSDKSSEVPEDLGPLSRCFAFNPEQAATCQGPLYGTAPLTMKESERGNFAGLYPPVYYYVMSAFASTDINASVVIMRVANSLFFTIFAATVYLTLPHQRKQAFIGAFIVTSVPLAMFLIPSTNPSSWAYLSGATLWISLLGYFETKGLQSIALAGLAIVSTIVGAGARADAAVYSGIAVCAALILKAQPSKAFAKKLPLTAAIGIISLSFYLNAGQTEALDGLSRSGEPVDKLALLYTNLLEAPDLFAGVLGKWRLGWLDTPMPAIVWVAAMGVFFGIVFMGFGAGGVRKAVGTLFVLTSLWLIPTYILVQSDTTIGSQVQPRYILPLIVMLAGVALIRPLHMQLRLNRSQKATLIVALGIANSVALHTNIRRYVTGTDHVGMNLDRNVEWWWNTPASPMLVWGAGSLAFGVLVCLLVRALSHTASAVPGEHPECKEDQFASPVFKNTGRTPKTIS